MAQIISLVGRKRDAKAPDEAAGKPPELVIFPGVNLGMLREVVRENKDKKAAAKRAKAPQEQP